jgi:hypothetical protein
LFSGPAEAAPEFSPKLGIPEVAVPCHRCDPDDIPFQGGQLCSRGEYESLKLAGVRIGQSAQSISQASGCALEMAR